MQAYLLAGLLISVNGNLRREISISLLLSVSTEKYKRK